MEPVVNPELNAVRVNLLNVFNRAAHQVDPSRPPSLPIPPSFVVDVNRLSVNQRTMLQNCEAAVGVNAGDWNVSPMIYPDNDSTFDSGEDSPYYNSDEDVDEPVAPNPMLIVRRLRRSVSPDGEDRRYRRRDYD